MMFGFGGRGGANLSEADRKALHEARLAAIKAGLMLTDEQQKNWPAVEAAVRELVRQREQGREQFRQQGAPENHIDRMKRAGEMLAAHGAAMTRMAEAARPLYNSLTEEQKRRLPLLMRGAGGHMGMARRHHHGMMGGYGQRWQRGEGRHMGGGYRQHWGEHHGWGQQGGRNWGQRWQDTDRDNDRRGDSRGGMMGRGGMGQGGMYHGGLGRGDGQRWRQDRWNGEGRGMMRGYGDQRRDNDWNRDDDRGRRWQQDFDGEGLNTDNWRRM